MQPDEDKILRSRRTVVVVRDLDSGVTALQPVQDVEVDVAHDRLHRHSPGFFPSAQDDVGYPPASDKTNGFC